MFNRALPAQALCATVFLAITAAGAGPAQYQDRSGKATIDSALATQFVKTGLYVISGGGSNSVLRLSANGLILVNGKLPGNYDALVKQATKISDQPIRVVIVTDYHENHTGDSAKFLAAGTGIIAQENVKPALDAYDPPGVKVVPPSLTYDHEYTLKLGGVEARLLHFGNAVTGGDTVVYFPNLKVVAVGDLFAPTPNPDFTAGGSLVGWGPTLAQVLKLDFDVAVPGTGPTATRADLEAFKTKVDTLVSRATLLVKKGVPKEQLMAQLKTDDLGWRFNFTEDQLNRFYAELSQAN